MSPSSQRWSDSASAHAPAEPAPAPPAPDESLQATMASDRVVTRPMVKAPVAFPGYEILEELGRGGMGVVYKARQQSLNRLVALKVILGGPLASDGDRARFRIEAEAAARLHHPNIVRVYDVGEYAGFSFIALELVEGETLRQWQNGRPVPPQQATRLVSAVARAIQHAHEHGVIHRDVKPANILLQLGAATSRGAGETVRADAPTLRPNDLRPKVTDFGLAKTLTGGADLTGTGVACGTPNYMAPEQVRGTPPTPAVDVYGLGGLLFELLAARQPFVGTDSADVMDQIIRLEAPDVRRFAPKAPRDLAVIAAKCLEKDPARRYATARELADDLDRYATGKPITARPVGFVGRLWRWSGRNPLAAVFMLLSTAGCLLAGGLALALLHSRNEERDARSSADAARAEAEEQRGGAEQVRDELARALKAAERERAAAQAAQEVAVNEKGHADAARLRSESDLRIAGTVIRDAIRELARDPKVADEELRGTRAMLLKSGRAFRDSVLKGNSDTRDWLELLTDVSHWLGFLEARNDNQMGAAGEYRAAADAAARWIKLEPTAPAPRARRAEALMGVGGSLANAGRFDESERALREAAALFDGIAAEHAAAGDRLELFDRRRAREAYELLVGLFTQCGKPVDRERAAWKSLDHSRELFRVSGEAAEFRWTVQLSHQGYAHALGGLGRWDEGECHFAAALELADRYPMIGPPGAMYVPERVTALLALAEYQNVRNHSGRADETFRTAVGILERAEEHRPADVIDDRLGIELGGACIRHANFLRARGRCGEAEKRFNEALAALTPALRRAPGSRPVHAAVCDAREGRADVYNRTGRHREAADEWAKLAVEDQRAWTRSKYELFVSQSLLYAGDWQAAASAARAAIRKPHPGWMQVDLGRLWCLIAKQIEADGGLQPEERAAAMKEAVGNAVSCLEAARGMGEFENPVRLGWYVSRDEDFAPVRGQFDPKKK